MSTRSGKRLHGSFHESTMKVDVEPAVKSERKTRSKRVKDNVDELSVSLFQAKKRNNYVSYPTDDEQNAEEAIKNHKQARQGRMLRRNTLKDQNILAQNNDNIETLTEPENVIRKSRRGKKNAEEQVENLENVQVQVIEKPKSKKNKKKTEVANIDEGTGSVVSKKSKRKKKRSKQSNSMVVEEYKQDGSLKNNTYNKSMSIESFHSATGSPAHICEDEEPALLGFAQDTTMDNNTDEIDKTRSKRKCSIKNTDKYESITLNADTTLQSINNRKSIQQDTTFEKNCMSIVNSTNIIETDGDPDSITSDYLNNEVSTTQSNINNGTFDKTTKIMDTTFEKDTGNYKKDSTYDKVVNETVNTTFEKDTGSSGTPKKKKSSVKDTTFDKNEKVNDTTFEKDTLLTPQKSANKILRTSNKKDTTLEINAKIQDKETVSTLSRSAKKSLIRKSSIKDTTFDKDEIIVNTTFEKDAITTLQRSAKKSLSRESIVKDATFDKSDNIDVTTSENETIKTPRNSAKKSLKESFTNDTDNVECSAKKAASRKSMKDTTLKKNNISEELPNSAKKRIFERFDSYRNEEAIEKHNCTFDKDLNTEFDGEIKSKSLQNESKLLIDDQSRNLQSTCQRNSKSSLLSSDNSKMDKSNISCISITSDESDNLVNTTLVLIESSMDNSSLSKEDSPAPQTPLKREGTFTKEGPEVPQGETPPKEESLPLAGCTPYHVVKSSQKRVLNVTRSIEKRRLSAEPPRMTRVMFCSPVDNPATAAHEKRKIIKSNLKGSNKSFVFDESVSGAARKRSYTQSDAEDARAKRSRLAPDLQQSVERLSRPRTASAAAKLTDPTTPSKKPATPSKSKSDAKPARTKLPNFAALHQRQFSKMESLGECQERKAKRARQLLTPNGAVNMLERISPKGTVTEPQKPKELTKKTDTPTILPTLESLRPGFTRFGFKLNLDVNPFSVPSKHPEPKPNKPNGARETLPSLAGSTSVRREVAKQAVMREKSFTDRRNLVKRTENRTIIKGVRTNRRFELQMKLRNVE